MGAEVIYRKGLDSVAKMKEALAAANKNQRRVEDQLRQALEAVRVMREEMQRASRFLDSIKYELNCSVYTVTDDEFDRVFGARDFLNEALAHPSVQAAVAQLEKDGLSRSGASRDETWITPKSKRGKI